MRSFDRPNNQSILNQDECIDTDKYSFHFKKSLSYSNDNGDGDDDDDDDDMMSIEF